VPNVRAHLQPGLVLMTVLPQAVHLNRLSGGAGVRGVLISFISYYYDKRSCISIMANIRQMGRSSSTRCTTLRDTDAGVFPVRQNKRLL